jgi:hypothetical protein
VAVIAVEIGPSSGGVIARAVTMFIRDIPKMLILLVVNVSVISLSG